MTFTEKELREQEQAFETVKEEFSRLNARFDGMLREAGLCAADLQRSLEEKHSPELNRLMEQARDEAARAGRARSAQAGTAPQTQSTGAGRPRPGAVRI